MPTPPRGKGHAVQLLAWVMHTPRRAALVVISVTLAVLVATVCVLALATRGGGDAARRGSPGADRSSCLAVATGFATAFFTDPTATGWSERVVQWVDPALGDPVTNIDPAGVPAGEVTFVSVDEQSGACDIFFTVAPNNLRVRIEASTTAGDGQWFVTGWGTP